MAFPSGWTKKRQLTIPAAQVGSGGVSSFTIPLKVTATSAKADGSDLRVSTGSDGTGLLTVDVIEAVGSGVFWIRVGTATLSSVAANTLYLWSGNASATAQAGSGAFDAGYAGYWPEGGGNDRTANGYDLTASGGVVSGGATLNALAATDYDGTDDHSDSSAPSVSAASAFTLMTWAQLDAYTETYNAVCCMGPDRIQLRARNNNTIEGVVGDGAAYTITTASFAWTTRRHAALVNDGVSQSLYVDGSFAQSVSVANPAVSGFSIGNEYTKNQRYVNGRINESQLHTDARSAAWITTEYNATNDPAAFLTQGAEENASTGNRRRRLIICGAA